ncbi:MAG: helix-turn-helix domain-containing protein [Polyangiales bacterium]
MSAVAKKGGHLQEILSIATAMSQAGLPERFVADAVKTAIDFEGVYDLMCMWQAEEEAKERDAIVADLQDLIDDCRGTRQGKATTIRFDDLEAIARDVRTFKTALLTIVNQRGGVTAVARQIGMPQPSLSRFFNTDSIPRRSTLLRIAEALDLSAVHVASKWMRH